VAIICTINYGERTDTACVSH